MNIYDLLDHLHIPFQIVKTYAGPIWTGEEFIFEGDDIYGDTGRWHELAHWLIATNWQRECPDLGLGQNVNGYGPWSSEKWSAKPFNDWLDAGFRKSWSDEPRICRKDAMRQETWATCAMGLASLILDVSEGEMYGAMGDFNAWFNDKKWTPQLNQNIVDTIMPQLNLKITNTQAFRVLEKVRKSGTPQR